jgi:hypothetical protein
MKKLGIVIRITAKKEVLNWEVFDHVVETNPISDWKTKKVT